MKQLKAVIKEVSKETPKTGNKSKSAKRRAKRRAAKARMESSVPGTVPQRSGLSNRAPGITFSHREYLGQLTVEASKSAAQGSFFLSPFSFPWLAQMSGVWEKYQWINLAVEYVPDVGTQTDGSIAVGVDWGVQSVKAGVLLNSGVKVLVGADYTRAGVLAMTPSLCTPVWKPAKLPLPKNLLQSRKWYDVPLEKVTTTDVDKGPGCLAYYVSATGQKVLGDIWVSYTIRMAGTRSATSS